MVIYTINGLAPKFRYIARQIRHLKPLPSFSDTRSMLKVEEQRLLEDDRRNNGTYLYLTTSSTTTFVTGNSGNQPPNRNGRDRGGRDGDRHGCGGRYGGLGGQSHFRSTRMVAEIINYPSAGVLGFTLFSPIWVDAHSSGFHHSPNSSAAHPIGNGLTRLVPLNYRIRSPPFLNFLMQCP